MRDGVGHLPRVPCLNAESRNSLRPDDHHDHAIIVADRSPLLHLGRIGRLHLIPLAVGPVTVPRTVWGELVQARTRVEVVTAIQSADWILLVDDPAAQDLGLDPLRASRIFHPQYE